MDSPPPLEITPELCWVAPFVADLVTVGGLPLVRLARIEVWPLAAGRPPWDEPDGACWPLGDGRYAIQIATERRVSVPGAATLVRSVSRADQLETLAHELAHLVHEAHDAFHEALTSRILAGFMARAAKDGVPLH